MRALVLAYPFLAHLRIAICLLMVGAAMAATPSPTINPQFYSTIPDVAISGTVQATPAVPGDAIGFSIIVGPFYGEITFDGTTGNFTYTPTSVGVADPIEIQVTDQNGTSSTAILTITTSGPDDARPLITSRPPVEYLFVGQTLIYSLTVDSSRLSQTSQLLTYSFINAPTGATITQVTGNEITVTWPPTSGQVGINYFAIEVVDQISHGCDVQQIAVVVDTLSATN